mgnify:CR=1 FL=1
MSKAFIAAVIQDSIECTGVAANQAATDLMAAIVRELKKEGGFTLYTARHVREAPSREVLPEQYRSWPRPLAFVAVGLSRTLRTFEAINNGSEFPAKQDRIHDVAIVAMYSLNERVKLSANWIYYIFSFSFCGN